MRFGSFVFVVLAALSGACTADTRPTADDFARDRSATVEDDATETPAGGGEVVKRASLLGEAGSPAVGLAHDDLIVADAPDAPRP